MLQSELDSLCDHIAELQVRRKFYIGAANKVSNSGKALIRRALGWQWDDSEASRLSLNERAGRIVNAFVAKVVNDRKARDRALRAKDAEARDKVLALLGKPIKLSEADLAVAEPYEVDLLSVGEMILPSLLKRKEIEERMSDAARRLPVHPWQEGVLGLGEKALAIIVGEAGNLSRFSHEDKLKKRLGLAPYGGKAYSRWRADGGLSVDEWVDAGYSPRRRAEIYAVIEPLFKAQSERRDKETGELIRAALEPYGGTYYRRRAHTAVTHPEWKPIQSHMDALRVMTQKVVTDLWSEWRRAERAVPDTVDQSLPVAMEFAA